MKQVTWSTTRPAVSSVWARRSIDVEPNDPLTGIQVARPVAVSLVRRKEAHAVLRVSLIRKIGKDQTHSFRADDESQLGLVVCSALGSSFLDGFRLESANQALLRCESQELT